MMQISRVKNERSAHGISVALCTYNGENYLMCQLDSISNQTLLPTELVVIDDCSNDKTTTLIEDFSITAPFEVRIYKHQKREGIIRSYSEAISDCRCEYIAPCDQDDYWLPNKLETLYHEFTAHDNTTENVVLVYSDIEVVDETLRRTGKTFLEHQGLRHMEQNQIGFCIVQNTVSGCSCMFRSNLKPIILPIPNEAILHDWWISLVSSYSGRINYINTSTILYRQHDSNTLGSKNRYDAEFFKRLINIKRLLTDLDITFTKSVKQVAALQNRLDRNGMSRNQLVESYLEALNQGRIRRIIVVIKYRIRRVGIIRNIVFIVSLLRYKKTI